jgi:hypothetical protein
VSLSEFFVYGSDPVVCSSGQTRAWGRREGPRPTVREPKLRNDMQTSGVGSSIICSDANVNVVWTILVLSVLEKNIDETLLSRGRATLTSTNTSQ